METNYLRKQIANITKAFFVFVIISTLWLLHDSVYYISGVSICFFSIPIVLWVIIKIKRHSSYSTNSFLILFLFSLLFALVIEIEIIYPYVQDKYGMIYSSKILGVYNGKHGIHFKTRMLNGTSEEVGIWKVSKKHVCDTLLFIYPQLAYEDKMFFFSLFHRYEYENNPTKPQIDYCLNGAVYNDKVSFLKKHSGTIKKDDIYNYLCELESHDNRVISAVLEKRGNRYVFVNPLQSEDKLWAIKYRNVDDGKKVLMIYDVNSPSLFAIIDWNPTDEDYDYYNTNEGRKLAFKYLLKLDAIASSSSSMEMEEN